MEHGPIVEVIPDIFVVSGVMRSEQNSTTAQFSRNMVIIREGEHLTIVNSILLDEDGLDELECLGMVTNVVSLGQAHGRDDEFYLDRWGGKLWAPANLQHRSGRAVDVTLVPEGPFPVENCSYIGFSATTGSDEGVLLLNRAGGILESTGHRNTWANTLAGVSKSRVFLGRSFKRRAIFERCV